MPDITGRGDVGGRRPGGAAIAVTALAGPAALVAMWLGGRPGAWILAAVASGLPVALLALADRRAVRRLGRATFHLALLALLGGSVAAVLLAGGPAVPAEAASRPAGLPLAAWALLVGVGLAPLIVLSWVLSRAGRDGS